MVYFLITLKDTLMTVGETLSAVGIFLAVLAYVETRIWSMREKQVREVSEIKNNYTDRLDAIKDSITRIQIDIAKIASIESICPLRKGQNESDRKDS